MRHFKKLVFAANWYSHIHIIFWFQEHPLKPPIKCAILKDTLVHFYLPNRANTFTINIKLFLKQQYNM